MWTWCVTDSLNNYILSEVTFEIPTALLVGINHVIFTRYESTTSISISCKAFFLILLYNGYFM
jgi:hypothetical protein